MKLYGIQPNDNKKTSNVSVNKSAFLLHSVSILTMLNKNEQIKITNLPTNS